MSVEAELSERKLTILKELSGDWRAGRITNPFKIHRFEIKFRNNKE